MRIEMRTRSDKALREAAINIAQYLPDDDDARTICELALRLRSWRDNGEPLPVSPDLDLIDN
jgi:hypothetical protein